MANLTPVDPDFIFDYVRLTNKALLLIDKQLQVHYCSMEAAQLLKQRYGLQVEAGYTFINQSSLFEAEVSRLVQQTMNDTFAATTQLPAEIKDTDVHFIDLHAYYVKSTQSVEPFVLLELKQTDPFHFTSQDQIKQIGEILNRLGDYVWIHNLLLHETWFSGDFNLFIGYASEELTPEDRAAVWWQSTHPDDRYLLKASDLRYNNGKQTNHSFEYRITDRYGKERWVLDKGIVVQWQQNKLPAVIIGTHTDITDMKKLQLEILQLKEQSEKNLILEAFAIAEEDRKFIANFLNENINQLLTAAHVKLNAGEHHTSGNIHNEVQHILQHTIEEIKDVCNQIDSSPLEMFELNDVLNDIVSFIQSRNGKKVKLMFHDARMQKKKHYDEELAMVRLFQDFLQYNAASSGANDFFAEVNYTDGLLKLDIRLINHFFTDEQYLYRPNVKLLVRRCTYFNGLFALTKSPADEVELVAELKLNTVNHQ